MKFIDILNSADSFRTGHNRCFEMREENGKLISPVQPAIVCLCFSNELYLKFLLAKKGITKKTHNLFNLYEMLNNDTKQRLLDKSRFDNFPKFEKEIQNHAKAFEEWRYNFESSDFLFAHVGFLEKFNDNLKEEAYSFS